MNGSAPGISTAQRPQPVSCELRLDPIRNGVGLHRGHRRREPLHDAWIGVQRRKGLAILRPPGSEQQPLGSQRGLVRHRSHVILGACAASATSARRSPTSDTGRCEQCAKAGRNAFRFRLFPAQQRERGCTVKAGELSPHALRQKWRTPLAAYKGTSDHEANLGLHELEMVTAKERVESLRVAPDLAGHDADVLAALLEAAERTDTAW